MLQQCLTGKESHSGTFVNKISYIIASLLPSLLEASIRISLFLQDYFYGISALLHSLNKIQPEEWRKVFSLNDLLNLKDILNVVSSFLKHWRSECHITKALWRPVMHAVVISLFWDGALGEWRIITERSKIQVKVKMKLSGMLRKRLDSDNSKNEFCQEDSDTTATSTLDVTTMAAALQRQLAAEMKRRCGFSLISFIFRYMSEGGP